MFTIYFTIISMITTLHMKKILLPIPSKMLRVKNTCLHMINSKEEPFLIQNKNSLYLKNQTDFFKDKKLILLSPGGFKGFYLMGITAFIKENYVLDDYIFSGASAGAWNALLMTYKHNVSEIVNVLLNDECSKIKDAYSLEKYLKLQIVKNYKTGDFELEKLFIGLTTISSYGIKTHIYSDFESLDDAVECCIGSSHIPYVTGNLINTYHNTYTFDGGFSKYPYLNVSRPVLHITPSMWKHVNNTNTGKVYKEERVNISDYTTLFSRGKYNFRLLYEEGYNDAKVNQWYLDNILQKIQKK